MDDSNKRPLENEDLIKVDGEESPFHDTDDYKEMLKEDIEKIMEETEAIPNPDEEVEVLEAIDNDAMQPIELNLDVVEEEPPTEIFYEEEKESKVKLWPILLITLVFAILLIFTRCTNMDLLGGKVALPTAGFSYYYSDNTLYFADDSQAADGVEVAEYEWNIFRNDSFYYESHLRKFGIQNPKADATYEIRYRVRDSKGNWSDYSSEKFNGKDIILATNNTEEPVDTPDSENATDEPIDTASTRERLDNYTITKLTDNLINDYDNNPEVIIRLKLALEDNNDFASFSLDGIFMDDDVSISFQIKTSDLNDKVITIKGMNQDNVVFTMTKEYTPKNVNNWELFNDNITVKNGDRLLIEVSGTGTVWLDDISIKAYK